ncbi:MULTISPECIES: prepilin-type N-terminal cleavage/methylation domain-containing protein [unclassified Microbacterium]|uniref:prepilin-type N-terminal cleavage/methylation domain-containing protein n=1 Tax=unclassified Microbacterium TaxID=2609290 RepID=UPI00364BED5E
MFRASPGFTIVELLVVIVVIAILASIATVAYIGITDRAQASQRISAIDAWEKAIRIYEQTHGSYPVPSGSTAVSTCLGPEFPAGDGFATGECILNNGSNLGYTANAEIGTMLKEYINVASSPFPTIKFTVYGMTIQQRGVLYYASNGRPGNNDEVSLMYYITTDQTCGRGTKFYDSANKFGTCKLYLHEPQ